jgi:tol-pal system protein YbgF
MEAEMQRLREMIERFQASGGNDQVVRNLQERVALIERRLGAAPPAQSNAEQQPRWAAEAKLPGQNPPQAGIPDKQAQPPAAPDPAAPVEIRNTPLSPEEKAYREAYAAFKSGSLDQSVALFDDFLKKHPKSQYAADAIYWIGEVRFGQGRFDEAVLQYDKVIKDFPGSKKELSALLKQGQAFEKMGDGKSAGIIFQKIIKEYPHTAQARAAAGKLKTQQSTDQ